MNKKPTTSHVPTADDPRQIAKWTRIYAQNRSLGIVVFMVFFLALSAAIGVPSYLAGAAYRHGNMPLLWICVAADLLAAGAIVYFAVPQWGGRFQESVVRRLYAGEGNVAFSVPQANKKIWAGVLAGCFGTCVLGSVVVDFIVDIPHQYMQPISALYVVPFLVGLWILMRPMAGWAALLWPALYAAHAILIVAGLPILFTKPWEFLNMLVPIAGYGLLSGLVGHLCSRFALRRLKRLTQENSASSAPSTVGDGQ